MFVKFKQSGKITDASQQKTTVVDKDVVYEISEDDAQWNKGSYDEVSDPGDLGDETPDSEDGEGEDSGDSGDGAESASGSEEAEAGSPGETQGESPPKRRRRRSRAKKE